MFLERCTQTSSLALQWVCSCRWESYGNSIKMEMAFCVRLEIASNWMKQIKSDLATNGLNKTNIETNYNFFVWSNSFPIFPPLKSWKVNND